MAGGAVAAAVSWRPLLVLLPATALLAALGAADAERLVVPPPPTPRRPAATSSAAASGASPGLSWGRPRRSCRRRSLASRATALAVAALTVAPAVAQSSEVLQHFDYMDKNHDGKVDSIEFRFAVNAAIQGVGAADTDERRTAVVLFGDMFDYADIDGNGSLCPRELEFVRFLQNTLTQWYIRRDALKKENDDVAGDVQEERGQDLQELGDPFGREWVDAIMAEHDTNKDGLIDKAEYDVGMRKASVFWKLGPFREDPALVSWYEDLYRQGDLNDDGILDRKEAHYVVYLSERKYLSNPWPDKKMASVLIEQLDANGDGLIDIQEVEKSVSKTDDRRGPGAMEARGPAVVHKIKEYFADADWNGDGLLQLGESLYMGQRLHFELMSERDHRQG